MKFYYVTYFLRGDRVRNFSIKNIICQASSVMQAEHTVRNFRSSEGVNCCILGCEPATLKQQSSKRIPLIR